MYVARQKMHIHNIPPDEVEEFDDSFQNARKSWFASTADKFHHTLLLFTVHINILVPEKKPGTNTRGADGKDETTERSLGSI